MTLDKSRDDSPRPLRTKSLADYFKFSNFESLESWRRQLALSIHVLSVLLTPLAIVFSFNYLFQHKHLDLLVFDIVLWSWTGLVLIVRRAPLAPNAASAMLLVFMANIFFHYSLGPGGARPVWIVITVIFGAALYGLRGTLLFSLMNLLMLIACYIFIPADMAAWQPTFAQPLSQWVMYVSNTIILTFVTGLTVASLLKGLQNQVVATKENDANYQLLAENINDVIWTQDLDFNFLYVSPSVLQQRGLTPDQVRSQPFAQNVLAESIDKIKKVMAEKLHKLETGDPEAWTAETLNIKQYHNDGHIMDTEITVKFLRIEGQKRPVVLGVARDISARIKAEEQNKNLQSQLQQAQKMEAVGRLAGGVAHDFNNVLCAINGNVELALEEDPVQEPEALQESLQEIQKAADRASSLTKQLLTFSRRQSISTQVLDLGQLINNLRPMLARLIGEDISLHSKIAEGEFQIIADAGQIEQALVNLVVNARDAMSNGGDIHVEIQRVNLDPDFCLSHLWAKSGSYVVMEVSDTGCGIGNELQEHIFEPFFTTKNKGEGTGLGLAMVHGIVEQNGGHIELYSESGHGATFRLYFPLATDAKSNSPVVEEKPLQRGQERILLVEDEEMVRKVALRILKHLGYQVLAADGPEQALEMFAIHRGEIDLLLTDVIMPNMNGKELADKIRSIQPDIKVLFTSGYTQNIIAQRGVLEHEIHFISKPYRRDALAHKLREVLDQSD